MDQSDFLEFNYRSDNIPKTTFYCVSLYMVDRAYGGAEEGGWWFTYGDPCLEHGDLTRLFTDEASALAYLDELQAKADEMNVGRYEISSMASNGRYQAIIDFDHYPRSFPEEQPRYE